MVRGVESSGGASFEGHKAQKNSKRLGIEVAVDSGGGVATSSLEFTASLNIPSQCQKEAAKAALYGRVL